MSRDQRTKSKQNENKTTLCLRVNVHVLVCSYKSSLHSFKIISAIREMKVRIQDKSYLPRQVRFGGLWMESETTKHYGVSRDSEKALISILRHALLRVQEFFLSGYYNAIIHDACVCSK